MSVKFHVNFKKVQPLSQPKNSFFFKGTNNSTIILIHGLTGTPNEMSFLARFLNSKGYSVTCPILANHGQPLEILKKTKWQDCYQSVRDEFMKISSGNERIFVSGLSMGALLALLLAEEFPQRINGVSCLSPTLFYDGWNSPWSRHLLPLAHYTDLKHFFYFKEESPYGIKNEALRALVHKYYNKARLEDINNVERYGYAYFPATLLYEILILAKYLIKRLPDISVPVQLIQAKEDDMTSVKNSQLIYDRVSSKTKEIVLLYNSYHVITADQEREKVAQEMERFFGSIKK